MIDIDKKLQQFLSTNDENEILEYKEAKNQFDFDTNKSLPNGLGDKLGETQQNIIKLMQNNPKIAITALASELGISTTTIEKHIKILKEQNIIQRIGGAKGGHWGIAIEENSIK